MEWPAAQEDPFTGWRADGFRDDEQEEDEMSAQQEENGNNREND